MKITFALLFAVLMLCSSCRDKVNADFQPYQIEFKKIDGSDTKKLQFIISMAANTHLYLDEGKRKNYIPISFRWDKENLIQPSEILRPNGEFDPELEVHVLRNKGTFIYSHPKIFEVKKLEVRAQVCDEQTNICYRPKWTTFSIN